MSGILNSHNKQKYSVKHRINDSENKKKSSHLSFDKVKGVLKKKLSMKDSFYVKSVEDNKNNKFNRILSEEEIKMIDDEISSAIIENLHMRTTFYEKILKMLSTNTKSWKDISFLAGKKKIEKCITEIEKEIYALQEKTFNFEKYKPVIYTILGLSKKSKFTETIVKNMYIAKLQNIIIILQSINYDDNLEEVSKNKTNEHCR